MEADKIQWHPAFASVLKLELKEYLQVLEISTEHQLNSKPYVIDVLIIKKPKDVQIKKNIGHIFKGYNIIEYKSPSDYLEIKDYSKVKVYAYSYNSLTDESDIDDLTITMVSSSYPLKMVEYLTEILKKTITKHCDGVYYIDDEIPIQLVVVDELSPNDVRYIRLLTKKPNLTDELSGFIKEFAYNSKDSDYELIMDILLKTKGAQIMEVLDVTNSLTQKEQEVFERVVEKFKWDVKWFEKGERKGKLEGLQDVARNLLLKGLDIAFVADVTGLALDEVRGLKIEN